MAEEPASNQIPDDESETIDIIRRARKYESERIAKSSFSERLRFLTGSMSFALVGAVLVGLISAIMALYLPTNVSVNSSNLNTSIVQLASAKKTLEILAVLSKNEKSASPDVQKLIELAKTDVDKSYATLTDLSENSGWASMEGFSLVSKAQAQELKTTAKEAVMLELIPRGAVRIYLMMFIIGVITLCLFGCLFMYFWTTDPDKVKFAANTIQTVLGFYIGVATGLIGLPAT